MSRCRRPGLRLRSRHRRSVALTTARTAGIGAVVQRVTLPQDDAPADLLGKLVSSTPPWFISLIVHFSIMIFLGLLVLGANAVSKKDGIEVDLSHANEKDNEIYAETLGEQLDDPSQKFSSEGLEPSKDPVAALSSADLPQVEHPLVGPPVLEPTPGGHMPVGTIPTPSIALEFSGREEGMKKALLQGVWRHGADRRCGEARLELARAAAAVARDVELARSVQERRQHRKRGSRDRDGAARVSRRRLHDIEQQERSVHARCDARVERAVAPSAGGRPLFRQPDAGATSALHAGAVHDRDLRAVRHDARRIVSRAGAEGGRLLREDSIARGRLAISAGRRQRFVGHGLVRDGDAERTDGRSRGAQPGVRADQQVPGHGRPRRRGSRYAYQFNAGATKPLTAEGLLSRQYLGWAHDDPRLRNGVDFLVANLPDWNDRNVYYWYYGTQVCHHMEGKEWQKWNEVMRQLLPEHQEKQGAERGSWDPNGDRWGGTAGRLYVTCLSLYTLEVYYRHLPIYQAKAMPAVK